MLQHAEMGQCAVMYTTDVPENCVGQVTILKYFAHYMEENLMDVRKLQHLSQLINFSEKNRQTVIYFSML